tara:strand:+ start:117 stop:239 length:123 start_codon:yes stop_codon:yes gene_type:complete
MIIKENRTEKIVFLNIFIISPLIKIKYFTNCMYKKGKIND